MSEHFKRFTKLFFLFVAFALSLGPTSFADAIPASSDDLAKVNKELMQVIGKLQNTVNNLGERLEQVENRAPSTAVVTSEPVSADGLGIARVAGGDIKISGFADVSAGWNFQDPATGVGANSGIRAFDNDSNSFNVNNVQLEIARPAPETDSISAGFRTEFMYGDDARVIDGVDISGVNHADEFAIQEAYVEVKVPKVPLTDGYVTVIAGKFATLLGAEVIENHLNWNASRGLLFQNAIAYTHTGVRAMTTFLDGKVSVKTGLVNGWDQSVDVNDVKDWELSIGVTPIENFSAVANFIIGSQQVEDAASQRGILDLVATWTPLPEQLPGLKLMANYDYGWEEDLGQRGIAGAIAEGGKADWQGYALYARYEVNPKLAFNYRFEQMWDDQMVRFAATDMFEHTFGADYKLTDNLLARAEYRRDSADGGVPFDGATSDHQNTILTSLIYLLG